MTFPNLPQHATPEITVTKLRGALIHNQATWKHYRDFRQAQNTSSNGLHLFEYVPPNSLQTIPKPYSLFSLAWYFCDPKKTKMIPILLSSLLIIAASAQEVTNYNYQPVVPATTSAAPTTAVAAAISDGQLVAADSGSIDNYYGAAYATLTGTLVCGSKVLCQCQNSRAGNHFRIIRCF